MNYKLHSDNGYDLHPAFSVKYYKRLPEPKHAGLLIVPESEQEAMRGRAYEAAVAGFWEDSVPAAIHACGFSGYYAEGRMGAWVAPWHSERPMSWADEKADKRRLEKLGKLLEASISDAEDAYCMYLMESLDEYMIENTGRQP